MRKSFIYAGMVLSLVIVLCGILVLSGVIGGDPGYANSAGFYDSGHATFGGDFYTYVNNNAADAASAVQQVAENQVELFHLIQIIGGIFLIGFGLMGFCGFGIVLGAQGAPVQVKNPAPADSPASDVPPAPEPAPFAPFAPYDAPAPAQEPFQPMSSAAAPETADPTAFTDPLPTPPSPPEQPQFEDFVSGSYGGED